MEGLLSSAIDGALARGAQFVEARAERLESEELQLSSGVLSSRHVEELGLSVRAFVDGAVGFAASPLGSADDRAVALDAARRAVEAARALRRAYRRPRELAPRPVRSAQWRTPVALDPFEVSLTARRQMLTEIADVLGDAPGIAATEASLAQRRRETWFAASDGARVHQDRVRVGAGMACVAEHSGVSERRSHPTTFGGHYQAGGFERVVALELLGSAERLREEARELVRAPRCPPGSYDLVLSSNLLMLVIHETVGHPTELDRVLGEELDLAGGSFLTPSDVGELRYGGPEVDLVADATLEGGLDTRGFDDEGTPSQRFHVVRGGRFVAFQSGRESAALLGYDQSRGAARAESWYHPPLVRITNLSLEPGVLSLDELLARCEGGIYCDGPKTWSIDPRRSNFQFSAEIGWEIRGGRRARMLRSPTWQGDTLGFWRSCDGIARAEHFQLWGVPNCGKGQPIQEAEMSHGAAPACFRAVTFVA